MEMTGWEFKEIYMSPLSDTIERFGKVADKRPLKENEQRELDRSLDQYERYSAHHEALMRGEKLDDANTSEPMSLSDALRAQSQPWDPDDHELVSPKRNGEAAQYRKKQPGTNSQQRTAVDPMTLDDGGFSNGLPEFFRSVGDARRGRYDDRLKQLEARDQSTVVGSEGGFMVPAQFHAQILGEVAEAEPYLGLRTIFPVSGVGELHFARWADEDRSGDDIGGLALGRVAENQAITEDSVALKQVTMRLAKAGRLIPVSNELLGSSSVGVDAALRRLIGRSVAMRQAMDFFDGTGSGEPLGIANGTDLIDVATTSGAGTIALADILGMLAKLDNGGGNSAVWICHRSVILALGAATAAGGNDPLWSPNGRDGLPATLFGLPIHYSDSAKQLNTVGDIVLANMNAYQYATTGIIIDASSDFKFSEDQTFFRVRMMDDGMPLRNSLKTDRQSYTTANFVRLETRV